MPEGALLLGFVTAQRLIELIVARRNTARLLADGGRELGALHYPFIVAFHTVWLAGLWLLGAGRPVAPLWLAVFIGLQAARLWVLATLGRRWTTRVIIVPGEAAATAGPYRLVRHPNYLVVALETAVVPLALGLPRFAAAFFVAGLVLLAVRIRCENNAWASLAKAAPTG